MLGAGPLLQRNLNYNLSKRELFTIHMLLRALGFVEMEALQSMHRPTRSPPSQALVSPAGSKNCGDEGRRWILVEEEEEEKMELWKLVPASQMK